MKANGAQFSAAVTEDKNKVLLLDASHTRQQARALGMRSGGAIVETADTGAEARALWKPGSHGLILIEFRGAGSDMYDFYRLALAASALQRFGFYTSMPPYISSSFNERSGDGDHEGPRLANGELQTMLRKGNQSARYRGGIPEAARRIAAIRPLTKPTQQSSERVSFSQSVKMAERVLGAY